ncbi:MAG: hypothetical protein ACI9R3_001271 [Verrucomicrobiales bacterium]|jgi:hypothetical protein
MAAAAFLTCNGFAQLQLNEFLAANSKDSGLKDGDGDSSDWLELYNTGEQALNLSGYFLTDDADAPRKWPMPAVSLPAKSFLIVFASGKDRTDPAGELHADFQLNRAEGSYLALTRESAPDSIEIMSVYDQYPQQQEDVSFGIASIRPLVSLGFFRSPTPGEANAEADSIDGFVADTKFSVRRGLFSDAFELTITSATAGATIIYTIDGSSPSADNGFSVPATAGGATPTASLPISTTTIVRAMATKVGWAATNIDTQSYIFPEAVLLQDGSALEGRRWGHAGVDWEMDPAIVAHEDPESRVVVGDLLRLPTISVALPFDNMFGDNGIYPPGPGIAQDGVERDCAIEYLNPNGSPVTPNDGDAVQTDGSIQIVGGSSTGRWKSDNLSMRLKFASDLDYPLFGDEGAKSFDTLVLDARLNHAWHYGGGSSPTQQRERALFVRDQLVADLQRNLGGYSPRGHHVHFYINGIYWGIRMLHERPDDNFAASYLGGDNADYDVMKHRSSTVVAGSRNSYRNLLSLAAKDLSEPENYVAVTKVLQIDEFINYMLVNFYAGNSDWAHQNWYASYNREDPNGKWRFHSWDAEHTFKSPNDNNTTKNDSGGPTYVHQRLTRNAEYKLQFADQIQEHFFNGGALTVDAATAAFMRRIDAIDLPIRAQSARWGDNQRSRPYTRGDEWIEERDRLLQDFFPARTARLLSQLRSRKLYPAIDAPVFSQHGGNAPSAYQLAMTASEDAVIYFTTDGSDPRTTGDPPEDTELIPESYSKNAFVPIEEIGSNWRTQLTGEGFDDVDWASGSLGAGFDNGTGYEPFIDEGLILKESLWGINATLYMRIEFNLDATPGPADALKLQARYDDGFVAYLNGTEVARANAEATEWNSSATGSHSDSEAELFIEFDISAFKDQLKVGPNLLAFQAMNTSAGGSDMLFHPKLVLGAAGGEGGIVSDKARLFTEPVVLQESTAIRARSLTVDGEWSAMSEATFLVDTEPASAANLVVSEIHYRPIEPSADEIAAGYNGRTDFEFLEFKNIGTKTIDLSGLVVTDGISFDFADASFQLLAPGEHVLLVENLGAFTLRYGMGAATRVAGVFAAGSQLSNGGEEIGITNSRLPEADQAVKSFAYDDASPWPMSADGDGFSLVLVSPDSNPDHGVATNWMASSAKGGSPGAAEGVSLSGFDGWLASFGLAGIDPADDSDNDGQSALLEYAAGTSPVDSGRSLVLTIEKNDAGGAHVSYLRPAGGASGVDYVMQTGITLQHWEEVTTAEAVVPVGEMEERVTISLTAAGGEVFVRLMVNLQ